VEHENIQSGASRKARFIANSKCEACWTCMLPPLHLLSTVGLAKGSVSNGSKFRGRFRVRFHPKPDRGNGSYHTKNPAHWKWAGFPPKTRHFKFTSLTPIKYLSSDHIMTWSVRRLCSFSCSFTSRCPICDQTSIPWVAIENPPISGKISLNFTAIRRILVLSQIWQREVKEQLKLHNLRTDHVMIRS